MKPRSCFLTIVLVFMASTVLAAKVNLYFLSKVKVNSDVVYLKDIVKNKTALPVSWQKIVIGNIVIPGGVLELSKQYILARLTQSGISPSQINPIIPTNIKIIRQFVKIPKEKIANIGRQCILEYANLPIKIKQIRAQSDLILPYGQVTYQCLPPSNNKYIGTFSLPILFKVNGQAITKTWITAKTAICLKVIVASRTLNRGEVINQSDFQVKQMCLTNMPPGLISDAKQLIGKRTKRFIKIGNFITQNDIENIPIVKRGNRVTIVYDSPVIKVTALGIAKQNGSQGQIIKVVNLSSHKVVYAKVVNSQTVKVGF